MAINIVLVRPEIPHNTGAIGRLCVGIDARLHLIRPLGFHLDNASIKRCGLDYWEHVDLVYHRSWDTFLVAEKPEQLVFASTKGRRTIYDIKFEDNVYIVFGNESSGLPPALYMTYKDQLYTIPMPGKNARSINLANAVAIVAYEALRQIGGEGGRSGK